MITTQPLIMAATIRASNKGLEIIDEARRKKGWAKAGEVWAALVPTSIPTLRRFWAGMAIQTETFQKICEVVGIDDWESIADSEIIDKLPIKISANRLSFAIAGSIENIDKHKLDAIVALLQKLGGDTSIEILDIDEGSIKVILGGSLEALERIEALFRSGELSEVSGISVQDVHFFEKYELIQLIKKNGGSALVFRGADLRGADLREVDLRAVDLNGADLRDADLRGADLRKASINRADLRDADLRGADLREAYMHRTNLARAFLARADLRKADLSEACLSGAYLTSSDLREALLREASFFGADLRFSELGGADLRLANFRVANLRLANFSGAILSNGDFHSANLSGANLSGVNLSGVNLSGAMFAGNIGLNESQKADMRMRGAIFEDAPESDVPSFVKR